MTDPRKWPLQGELSEFALTLIAAADDGRGIAELLKRNGFVPWTGLDECVLCYLLARMLAKKDERFQSSAVDAFHQAAMRAREAGELEVAALIDTERAELKRALREERRAKQQGTGADPRTRRASAYARGRSA